MDPTLKKGLGKLKSLVLNPYPTSIEIAQPLSTEELNNPSKQDYLDRPYTTLKPGVTIVSYVDIYDAKLGHTGILCERVTRLATHNFHNPRQAYLLGTLEPGERAIDLWKPQQLVAIIKNCFSLWVIDTIAEGAPEMVQRAAEAKRKAMTQSDGRGGSRTISFSGAIEGKEHEDRYGSIWPFVRCVEDIETDESSRSTPDDNNAPLAEVIPLPVPGKCEVCDMDIYKIHRLCGPHMVQYTNSGADRIDLWAREKRKALQQAQPTTAKKGHK